MQDAPDLDLYDYDADLFVEPNHWESHADLVALIIEGDCQLVGLMIEKISGITLWLAGAMSGRSRVPSPP